MLDRYGCGEWKTRRLNFRETKENAQAGTLHRSQSCPRLRTRKRGGGLQCTRQSAKGRAALVLGRQTKSPAQK